MSHVLLIEPDTVLARTYRQALEHAGHSVAVARGAQQALNVAGEQKPDLVVLELQLAGHGGIEFLHEFRSYGEWQDIPAAINTHVPAQTLTSVEDALRRDLGVQVLLYKPRTSLQRLISVVNELTSGQASEQAHGGRGA